MITGKGVWDKWGLDDGMLLFGAYWSFVIAEVRKHLFCELLVAPGTASLVLDSACF